MSMSMEDGIEILTRRVCRKCNGKGRYPDENLPQVLCPVCFGAGYEEKWISLENILSGFRKEVRHQIVKWVFK